MALHFTTKGCLSRAEVEREWVSKVQQLAVDTLNINVKVPLVVEFDDVHSTADNGASIRLSTTGDSCLK
jgi:hypothetical protein